MPGDRAGVRRQDKNRPVQPRPGLQHRAHRRASCAGGRREATRAGEALPGGRRSAGGLGGRDDHAAAGRAEVGGLAARQVWLGPQGNGARHRSEDLHQPGHQNGGLQCGRRQRHHSPDTECLRPHVPEDCAGGPHGSRQRARAARWRPPDSHSCWRWSKTSFRGGDGAESEGAWHHDREPDRRAAGRAALGRVAARLWRQDDPADGGHDRVQDLV
mmetsp:Transcript_27358/g.71629  ORF Transcript_27358/g.71629 Transcript_27358/m.71629 type:complete len:215 (-) Transcript_27358:511-1155(-)